MSDKTKLNNGIVLTDDDVQVVSDQEQVGDYNVKFLSLEGYDIVWSKEKAEQLKLQILNNQTIVKALHEKLSYYKKYSGNSLGLGDRIKDYMIETCEEILRTTSHSKGSGVEK